MEVSDYIALSSVVIALSAMSVAIWQSVLARRHNILSVQPRFQIHTNKIHGLKQTLQNNGLGPALIKNVKISCGDKVYENPEHNVYEEIFKDLGFDPANHDFSYEYHIPHAGRSHAKGHDCRLLDIKPITAECSAEVLNKIHETIKYEITYTSLYEEREYRLTT